MRRDRTGIESTPIVGHLYNPVCTLDARSHGGARRRGVFVDILQCLLHHAQGHRGGPAAQGFGFGVERRGDRQPRQRSHAFHRVEDRRVEAELVEQRWPELADDRADLPELAPEHVAQVAQLGASQRWIGIDNPLDMLHLKDRIRQRLGGAVMDFASETRPFGLLRLNNEVHRNSSIRIGFHRQTISNTRVGAMPMSISRKHSLHGAPASMSSGQCSWSSPSDRTT